MPQCIQSKYLCATNTRGARIKVWCERGSLTVPWNHSEDVEMNHRLAASALCLKFAQEDKIKYGTKPSENPWCGRRYHGQLPNGTFAHVFAFAETVAAAR